MAAKKGGSHMPCPLLHMIEMPEPRPYDDEDVKDVIGNPPQLFCAYCNPPLALTLSESARCLGCEAPCWKVGGVSCSESAEER